MITIKNLNKTYDRYRPNANKVLHDVSLTLPDTGFVCILGPSGCGKTSLLNAMGGLDAFDSGTLSTGTVTASRYGTALFEAERNRNFGYIFQNYYLLPDHSAGYNVYLGLHSLDLSHDEKLRRVEEALRAVEMERYFRRNVGELSGGQQQRVAIARALARRPRVIFADEPTGNLDEANTRNICALLRRISKTSLVVMITHEESIARFFADRIITLENGRIRSDSQDFRRSSLSDSHTLYTGDYAETLLESEGVRVRFYREEGCDGVDLSILALKDRVVIKLSDGRTVTCTGPNDQPTVVYGQRPRITLEQLEQEALHWTSEEAPPAKAGKGIRFRDMLSEARRMSGGRGLRSLGTRLFLILLTVLTAVSAADIIALSQVDPRDFITTHSQVLMVSLERGPSADEYYTSIEPLAAEYKSWLDDCGLDFTYVPDISRTATVSGGAMLQTRDLAVTLRNFTYTPLSRLPEDTLVLGRMPENAGEVVVDRWILDAVMSKDGVAQNGITSIDYFLDKQVTYQKLDFSPTIVGICDSGEPAVYILEETFATLGTGGTAVASLSTLQKMFPGKYDDVVLAEGECIVLPANAGSSYRNKLHANYTTKSKVSFEIVMSIEETELPAKIVVADDQIDRLLYSLTPQKFYVFCENKAEMKRYLESVPEKMDDLVSVTVKDIHAVKMAEYRLASQLRLDARTIVTATVMALSVVMLYLLRRSQILSETGMLAVYRLLGIPRRKIAGIFCLESILSTLTAALPAAAAVWCVLRALEWFPSLEWGMPLPWQAAVLVYLGITAFHLLVTLVPLSRLLKMPPAQLAAKFDF